KKIATVKYGEDTIKLRGDGENYVGLLHTPLGELLIGKVGKVPKSSAPIVFAPIVTFAYSDNTIRAGIYNHIRHLRNEILSSTWYNRHSNKERYWIEWTRNGRVIHQSSNSKWCWKACSVTPRKKTCAKNLVSQAR